MTQRIWGEATVYDCNDIEVKLESGNIHTWLNIRCYNNGNQAQLTLFFKDEKEQETVLDKLYTEIGKLQPKF